MKTKYGRHGSNLLFTTGIFCLILKYTPYWDVVLLVSNFLANYHPRKEYVFQYKIVLVVISISIIWSLISQATKDLDKGVDKPTIFKRK